jgi:hypothetical protein
MAPVLKAAAVAMASGTPLLIWGGPGVGKTASITAMVEGRGWPIEVVIASIREPSDFAGLPIVTGDEVRFAPPSWAKRLASVADGVVFLDELSTAPPAVQAALLRVVLERSVGDLQLPGGIRIVAAANPPAQAADGWELAAPLANRFCHLDWQLDHRDWVDGVLSGFASPTIPVLDPDRLRAAVLATKGEIAAFIVGRPQHLHAVPKDMEAAGRAWPSPRTWTMLATVLGAARTCGVESAAVALLAAGCVGPVAAGEFISWSADLALPDPETVLADPSSFQLPNRTDRAYAALASITAATLANNTPARWGAAWEVLGVAMASKSPDVAVVAVRTLIANRPTGAMPPRDVLAKMTPLLRDAGLLDSLLNPPITNS